MLPATDDATAMCDVSSSYHGYHDNEQQQQQVVVQLTRSRAAVYSGLTSPHVNSKAPRRRPSSSHRPRTHQALIAADSTTTTTGSVGSTDDVSLTKSDVRLM